MTNIFFRRSRKRSFFFEKKAENTRLSLQFFWASNYQWSFETLLTIHHWIYVLSLPYHVDLSSFFRVKYVTMFNDTFPTCTQLLMLINWCSSVTRESEAKEEEKKCVHENQELHFKMLVFIALVWWTFACGYTNVVFALWWWRWSTGVFDFQVAPWISSIFFGIFYTQAASAW